MPVWKLNDEVIFPDPNQAEPDGLLAVGGDLRPERLLAAYAAGIFPWYAEGPILWYSPDPRMVLAPGALRVARSLRKVMARQPFEIRFDTAFERVIRACAKAKRPGQDGTWIAPSMIAAYCRLHEMGYAHSVEAWADGELAGGLYGISLGAAFFGESMFARREDASKVAFVQLVRRLEDWRFELVDCQIESHHMARFGAKNWPRTRFLTALERAVHAPTRRGPWSQAEGPS